MNNWLDNGIFLLIYTFIVWGIDSLTINQGYVTFGSLAVGAIVLLVIGFIVEFAQRKKRV